MQRRHSFTLPTLLALAFPAMLTNCAAEAPTDPDPGTGAVGGSAGTATAGTPGAGTAGTAPGTGGTGTSGAGGSAGSVATTGGSAGTGDAGTGTAGTGTAGTGTAGTGTAGTGTAGAGGSSAGAGAGGTDQGGTAGTGTAGTSGTGTGAGGYNTDAACMGIKTGMACPTQDLSCPNLRCGLSDLGRRACVCSTNWSCESCAFPSDAPQEIVGMPAAELAACDASVVKGDPCTTQGDRCQPAEAGDVCACWPIGGTLEWDCDSKPWE